MQTLAQSVPLIPPGKILFLGDSVTYGVRAGVTEAQTYRCLVACVTGSTGINGGVPGDNTTLMLSRLPALLSTHAPDVVTIMSGINDALGSTTAGLPVSIDLYQANLLTMIGICSRAGAKVVLCTPNAVPGSLSILKPYVCAMRYTVAQGLGVPLVDAYQLFAERTMENGSNDYVLPGDVQHPSPAGHAAIASEMNWVLTKARL